MTRATLLQVLARPTALGPAEVRELEQLAQAFPYCQTAHLLLAKAAHDHGTMLAGQRLRRAATYAADRALLRRLIEEVEPAPVEEPAAEPVVEPAVVEPIKAIQPTAFQEEAATVSPAPEPQSMEASIPAPMVAVVAPQPAAAPVPVVQIAEEVAPEATPEVLPPAPVIAVAPAASEPVTLAEPMPAVAAPVPAPFPGVIEAPVIESAPVPMVSPLIERLTNESPGIETLVSVVPTAENTPTTAEAAFLPEAEAEAAPPAAPVPSEVAIQPASEPETAPIAAETPVAAPAAEAPEAEVLPALMDQEGVDIPAASPARPDAVPAAAPEEEPDLPAQAPAIRPPVEAGEARFEFGLAEPPPAPPAYELPGLVDEWAAAAVTLSLGGPEPVADFVSRGAQAAPASPALTPAAFTGDAAVGYGFAESSRLGFSMQLLTLLTDKAEAEAAAEAAAQPPATALPPPGAFFEPDPLLLDHWAAHRPPAPALPSSLDLINNFLKRQPRLTRPGMLAPTPGGQTDLSVRSTRAEPDLVSENLARIFVRQGKTARAIEIYEKLMVKQPEKMAYFTAQIQSLQP